MKKNIFKKIMAFSLVEVLLSMAILSIFIVGTMKVMTVKPSARKIEYPHGYFECYWDNGTLKQRHYFGSSLKYSKDGGSYCTFEPPNGAAFLSVNIASPKCNPDPDGSPDENLHANVTIVDKGNSLVHSEMQSYANNDILITPQKGSQATKLVTYDDDGKKYEVSYESAKMNVSEYTLLKHMEIVSQETTRPEMYEKLLNDNIGCTKYGDGYYGGVFISW